MPIPSHLYLSTVTVLDAPPGQRVEEPWPRGHAVRSSHLSSLLSSGERRGRAWHQLWGSGAVDYQVGQVSSFSDIWCFKYWKVIRSCQIPLPYQDDCSFCFSFCLICPVALFQILNHLCIPGIHVTWDFFVFLLFFNVAGFSLLVLKTFLFIIIMCACYGTYMEVKRLTL